MSYNNWTKSRLAAKLDNELKKTIDNIWGKALSFYSRTTWPGWIDHGIPHVLNVLKIIDELIPNDVHQVINEEEAFLLIAGALLHDIGMIPPGDVTIGVDNILEHFTKVRNRHGELGAQILEKEFNDFFTGRLRPMLGLVCEIIKNHHGEFNPPIIPVKGYNFRATALWIRLADELDFGRDHAPTWIREYIEPGGEQLQHWMNHYDLETPRIDLELLRVHVRGKVQDDIFINKLRAEFETKERQDLQSHFLNRGSKVEYNRTFLIWDLTEKKPPPGDDRLKIQPRLILFTKEHFFSAARSLYNLGKFNLARELFEEGINRVADQWLDENAKFYFYHYLQTLNGLGLHREALEVAQKYEISNLSPELEAAIASSNGQSFWKIGQFEAARGTLGIAAAKYNLLAKTEIDQKINIADTLILQAITYLEEVRKSPPFINTSQDVKVAKMKKALKEAENLYAEYERAKKNSSETHYKGRYWGAKAFYCLLEIDFDKTKKNDLWSEAKSFAEKAYGGVRQADRNPFGILCGKYCAAAVYYHEYINSEMIEKDLALYNCAKTIKEIWEIYEKLFGFPNRIPRLWTKIYRMFYLIYGSLQRKFKKELQKYFLRNENVEDIEIFTPLN